MPVEAVIKFPKAAAFKPDEWIRVGGTLGKEVKDDAWVPVIKADKIDLIPAPKDPYISPVGYQF